MSRVLYIVGKGRSGSTLLDRLLGRYDGVFSTGELSRLWDWGVVGRYPCSCGRSVWDCEIWGPVLSRLGVERADGPRLAELTRWALAWARLPVLLGPGDAIRREPRLRSYTSVMADLYRAVAEVTGCHVLVDSSKWPAHPGLLGLVDGVDPCGVQVTRDPRGVAFSYLRHKATGGRQPPMPRFPAIHSASSWVARNALVELVRMRVRVPIARVRYEDLALLPEETLASLEELIGSVSPAGAKDAPGGPSERGVVGEHLVGGNPDRFDPLEIRADDEWRGRLGRLDGRVVTAIAAPLLGRYGYPIRGYERSPG